jgi:hypothetical protein
MRAIMSVTASAPKTAPLTAARRRGRPSNQAYVDE